MATATIGAKPVLHVEVRLFNSFDLSFGTESIRDEVSKWLPKAFTNLGIGQHIVDHNELQHASLIESVDVVDYTGPDDESLRHRLSSVSLDVQVYKLHGNGYVELSNGDEDGPKARVMTLPSQSLQGDWESLVFNEEIPARLLRFITRMMTIMKNLELNINQINFNGLILLYGSPGTGKTTLCRALAQKITIRLGQRFKTGKLIEVDTSSLLSRYFSESGKHVSKIFDQVCDAAEEQTTLICVLIDEVESLAASRSSSAAGNDCKDGMRATNELLTGLDRVRRLPNVVVLCTSNLLSLLDVAFLDRVDVKQYTPNPCEGAIYSIFRSCLNDFIRTEFIQIPNTTQASPPRSRSSSSSTANFNADVEFEDSWEFLDTLTIHRLGADSAAPTIPSYDELIHHWAFSESPGSQVWAVARKCKGMSGRTLRRLPGLALAMYTYSDSCTFTEAMAALNVVVEQELKGSVGL